MKRILSILVILLCVAGLPAQAQELLNKIQTISKVKGITPLESKVRENNFKEKYVLKFEQMIDPSNPAVGTFTQRVFVSHRGFNKPTVIVTEGYNADYAGSSRYEEELSRLLDANLIVVEYRYFAESTPNPCNYDYLTVANSLVDLHNVVTTFKQIYTGKWISTGISKGGMTCMFYRSYYPDDVDVSIPYVAPLNKATEDGRHEKFLAKKVGTPEEREAIKTFQTEVLKRRATLVPMMEKLCQEKKWKFRGSMDEIFDLSVMEYSFAMWQWGTPVSSIPSPDSDDQTLFKHLMRISSPDYFSYETDLYSFNVQAARELGYYGYDLKPFKKYTFLKDAEDYMHKIMLKESESNVKFNKSLYKYVTKWLKKNDPKMIYIYGGIDPWGCSGVGTWLKTNKKKNLHIYTKDRGSHSTRISSFDEPTKNEIINLLKSWL